MNKQILIELIEKKYSTRRIANELNISQSTIKYWLNKFELKTKYNQRNKINVPNGKKYCSKCETIKSLDEFYKFKRSGYCKSCRIKFDSDRFIKRGIELIKYKGGECKKCKLKLEDTHYSVFDFHHRIPTEKDLAISNIKHLSWKAAIKEADKCDLLCANCHRIEHYA